MRRGLHPLLSGPARASIWLLLAFMAAPAGAAQITAANTSRYLGDGRWEWSIYIQASPQVVQSIQCVEYTLHPSFANRLRRVCEVGDEKFAFRQTAVGWGTFEIPIKIIFKSGSVQSLTHQLSFKVPAVSQPVPIKTGNTARKLGQKFWNWTVFIEAPEQVLGQVRCVEYKLHPTFPKPIRTVCERGVGPRAFPLSASGWGTFEIGVRVILKNGKIQEMKHRLIF